jgi:hypothetical protein
LFVQLQGAVVDAVPCHLLCIDLQPDAIPEREPAIASIAAARQLLALGRRLGWSIAHTRRRTRQPVIRSRSGGASGLNPLMSEQVFFHDNRSVADSASLASLLHGWREETVFVASFDHVALLSCLLACYEPGPRLVIVEDVMSLQQLGDAGAISAFHGAAWRLAFGATSIDEILADVGRKGVHMFPLPASAGELGHDMPV